MMEVLVGLRVVRGPDWRWGDQDGGEGHVGTVVEVGEPCNDGVGAVVQWDCGERCKYRCGQDGKYDLRVLDSAPAGFGFGPYSICHGCMEEDINGFSWKCTRCNRYTLCSYCYFSGKHLLDHQFARFDAINTRSFVSPRSNAKSIMAKGLFPGARVKRGPDMKLRDGNVSGIGIILDYGSRSFRKSMCVKWERTGEVTECRAAGTNGKVDVLCVEPVSWCCYFPEHLPSLGAPICPPKGTEIMSGDLVQVLLDSEIFRMMQAGDGGGWNDKMALLVGRLGCVKNLKDKGNLNVCYHGEHHPWVINPDAVVKIESLNLAPGDFVRVIDDAGELMSLQLSAGIEWTVDTCDCLGKIVKVMSVKESGIVSVELNQNMYELSPLCLPEGSNELLKGMDEVRLEDRQLEFKVQSLLADGNPDVVAYAAKLGDVHVIRGYLKSYPNESKSVCFSSSYLLYHDWKCNEFVNSKVEGKAPIHWAVQASNVDAVKCLLEHFANVNVLDDFFQLTPLSYCIMYSRFITREEIAQLLLDGGADPNLKGIDGFTPVMKTIVEGDIRVLKVLVKHPKTNIHQEDEDGETPLHRAILLHQVAPVKLLLEAGADPTRLNNYKNSAVHLACGMGNAGALKEILDHNPELINLRDSKVGFTPLHLAISQGHQNVVSFLVQQPRCNINAKTRLNKTALHGAVIRGEAEIIELLVGYGADLNVQDAEQSTPLHIITQTTGAEQPNPVRIISQMTGADPSELDFGLFGSATPDFLKGTLSMAGINALKAVRKVSKIKISDKTPKLFEIRKVIGREVSAEAVVACFLIQEGANLHLRNIRGQTPLESCTNPVLATVLSDFAGKNAGKGTFHGSLCQNRPATSQAMPIPKSKPSAHDTDTQKNKKVSLAAQDCKTSNDIKSNCSDATPNLCGLCEEENVDVVFLPCGHKLLCHLCAVRAVRCLDCKTPITEKKSIDIEPVTASV